MRQPGSRADFLSAYSFYFTTAGRHKIPVGCSGVRYALACRFERETQVIGSSTVPHHNDKLKRIGHLLDIFLIA